LDWKVEEDEVLTGSDIRILPDEELLKLLPKIKIFARVTPEDKMRIGQLYRKLGEIVAMTGDGVNDAPALKAMDIGISLGSASDVAKSAADLILLDDNFTTISLAISGKPSYIFCRTLWMKFLSSEAVCFSGWRFRLPPCRLFG
ncbi:MAG: ATPase, P-type (Transporting), HAD superfamily, subfamily IC, partial [Parcubacteria group bacterium GW2011_GWF2_44_7]